MIYQDIQITVNQGLAVPDKSLYIFRGDSNIILNFKVVSPQYKLTKDKEDNLVTRFRVDNFELRLQLEKGYDKIIRGVITTDGYCRTQLTQNVIQELRAGSYSYQITLIDDDYNAIMTFPICKAKLNILDRMSLTADELPIPEGLSGESMSDLSLIVDKEEVLEVFDSNGNYIKTDWSPGDVISSAKLNKVEEALVSIQQTAKEESGTANDNVNKLLNELEGIASSVDSQRQGDETWDVTINRIISEGKTVRLLDHEYELYNTIYFRDNTNIEMSKNTVLVRKHSGYMFTNTYDENSVDYGATNGIHITNGFIVHNGNTTAKNCCILFHANDITFTNVTFKNIVASHAIDLVGCENVNIIDCKFFGYDHEVSTVKYRELIQIDAATYTGAGFGDIFPTNASCYDGTRTRNVLIENCVFDGSETLPPAHNCIGTHSQVAPPLRGDSRCNNIKIINNRFKGNQIITTERDDDTVAMAGKCIRLIHMENVVIENNVFENFGRTVSIEIFKKCRTLDGGTITDVDILSTYPIQSINIVIAKNKMYMPELVDDESYYKWNGIAVSSSITSLKHENVIVSDNTFYNYGQNNNESVGIRNLQNGIVTSNHFIGGNRGLYVETENGLNVKSSNNNFIGVNKPIDYVGAFSNNSGECVALCEDGTKNEYQLYVVNAANSSEKPQMRIKCATTGKYATLLTDNDISMKLSADIDGTEYKKNMVVDINQIKSLQIQQYAKIMRDFRTNKTINILTRGDSLTYGYDENSADKRDPLTTPTDSGREHVRYRASKTYPEALKEYIDSIYEDGTCNVENIGYSGAWVKFSFDLYNNYRTNNLEIIMLGTNDSRLDNCPYKGDVVQYTQYYEQLIVREILMGNALILMQSLQTNSTQDLNVETFRVVAKMLGEKYSIPVLDASEMLEGYPSSVWSDATHLNGEGYTILGYRIGASILNENPVAPKKVDENTVLLMQPALDSCYYRAGAELRNLSTGYSPDSISGGGRMACSLLQNGSEIVYTFYAEQEGLIVMPSLYIYNGGTVEISLNNKVQQARYRNTNVYYSNNTWDGSKPSYVSFTNSTGSAVNYCKNNMISMVGEDNILTINNKGWHTLRFKNLSSKYVNIFGIEFLSTEDYITLKRIKTLEETIANLTNSNE